MQWLHWSNRPTLMLCLLTLLGLLLVLSVTACQPRVEPLDNDQLQPAVPHTKRVSPNRDLAVPVQRRGPLAERIKGEPILRVRIYKDADGLKLQGASAYRVGLVGLNGRLEADHVMSAPLSFERTPSGITVTGGKGQVLTASGPDVGVMSSTGESIAFKGKQYPGVLVVAHGYRTEPESTLLDVMNYVPMETYLPGVLTGELYGNWELDTFRTQAVAARTYAIFEASMTRDKSFDLESTTASQVYTGQTLNPTALAAVQDTKGQVLVYARRIVPAFYSADSGGAAASAWDAFGNVERIAPLRSRDHYDIGSISPHTEWGPIDRSAITYASRVKLWGQNNDHPVGRLNGLVRIIVSKRTAAGRPVEFTLVDLDGNTYAMKAEQFRWASNYARSPLPPLEKSERLKSSFVDVEVRGPRVVFLKGHGYGHGVGLSQWGAQDMAQRGYNYREILSFFYPDASIQKVY